MKRTSISVAIIGALLAGTIVAAKAPRTKRIRSAPGEHRMAYGGETSVTVEGVRLNLAGRENALGASCEVAVRNPSGRAVERGYRILYYSHTGAELLRAGHDEEEWTAIRLEPGERKVLTQECPFYTAREAQVRWR